MHIRDGYPGVLIFHRVTILCELRIHRVITYVYPRPKGDKYAWLCPIILYDCLKARVTDVRWDNSVALRNTVLQDLPVNFELVPSTQWLYLDNLCNVTTT